MACKEEGTQVTFTDVENKDVEIANLKEQIRQQKEQTDLLIRQLSMLQLGHQKPITKSRDIPVLELKHLHGLESASRLNLFFEQVESCATLSAERIEVARLRVSIELAMRLQALIAQYSITTWDHFKTCLRQEFATELNFDQAWQHIDRMTYDWVDSPQAFVNEFICQYSILETKFNSEELPNRDKLLKRKLLRGMPSDTHEKLSSFLESNIPLRKFIDRVETERSVRLHNGENKVSMINQAPENDQVAELKKQVDELTIKLQQSNQPRETVWCNYCKTTNHHTKACRNRPRYVACFDCNKPNCRRGHPQCPVRKT